MHIIKHIPITIASIYPYIYLNMNWGKKYRQSSIWNKFYNVSLKTVPYSWGQYMHTWLNKFAFIQLP